MQFKIIDDIVKVSFEGKNYEYWIWGYGLIPLHKKKCLFEEWEVRHELKNKIFGISEMKLRRKGI